MLYMFRTILVHHQEQLFISYTSHLVYAGICRYVWLFCGYGHTTARRMVPAYTGIYQMRCAAYKVAPDDGLIQSETCRASNEKIKFNHRKLCILLVYIHIVRWWTVHTTSNSYSFLLAILESDCVEGCVGYHVFFFCSTWSLYPDETSHRLMLLQKKLRCL